MRKCQCGAVVPPGENHACAGYPMMLSNVIPLRKPTPAKPRPVLEAHVMRRIREEAGRMGDVMVWRNNTGSLSPCPACKKRLCPACAARFARPFMFGLCEGSSDLVGLIRVPVDVWRGASQETVLIARFVAYEVKAPGKKPRPEQLAYLDLVRKFGGAGGWGSSVDDFKAFVERVRLGVE